MSHGTYEALVNRVVSAAAAFLLLAVAVHAQSAHTAFKGAWIGMTPSEFLATDTGVAISARYRDGCTVDKYGLTKDTNISWQCNTWKKLSDPDLAAHPWNSNFDWHEGDLEFTVYHFEEGKLVQIQYNPDGGGAAIFKKQIEFLTQKYGKPTDSGIVVEQNEFGARLSYKVVQWKRPDGVVIQAKSGTFSDAVTQIIFERPNKPTAVKNPY